MLRRLLYRYLMRERLAAMDRMAEVRSRYVTREAIERYQVEAFNRVWAKSAKNVPIYRRWKAQYSLPDQIGSLDELVNWPILTKADLRIPENFKRTDVAEPIGRIMTGGSTGEPVHLPAYPESRVGISQALGRRAYGVELGDRTLLLWGHEHLYGTGFKRTLNVFKRRFKDWLADWRRVSAYDLGHDAMRRAYRAFEGFRPRFVIGFSPAVLAFCRQNHENAGHVKSVRVVLCTAGPLTEAEKTAISDFFGAPVCMEYGSVECGVMGYTRPADGAYNAYWHTHLLQAVKDSNGEYKNIVTRFDDLYCPLIRYDIGDYLDLDGFDDPAVSRSVIEMRSVKGRPSEMIAFECGVSFFGALIGDCVKQVPRVVSSQIAVDERANYLEIRVTADGELTESEKGLIDNRIRLVVQGTEKLMIVIKQCEELFTTIGGKTPRVVRVDYIRQTNEGCAR